MNDNPRAYVQLWLDKAQSDMDNAAIILASQTTSPPFDTVCFHCQQAAEKLLKAFLVSVGKSFPFTHNLADLVALCSQADSDFASLQRKAETLTPFAVEIRYPDDFYMPKRADAEQAYAIATRWSPPLLTFRSIAA